MEDDNATVLWLADLLERLESTKKSIDKEQALMQLLLKITNLMKSGDFKAAAFLRIEFDRLNARKESFRV